MYFQKYKFYDLSQALVLRTVSRTFFLIDDFCFVTDGLDGRTDVMTFLAPFPAD